MNTTNDETRPGKTHPPEREEIAIQRGIKPGILPNGKA